MNISKQLLLLAAATLLSLAWHWFHSTSFIDLWLTPDQQGRLAYERLEFSQAAATFENPAWAGIAHYDAGEYTDAAALFSRSRSASAAYNRGNALIKGREYGNAITAFELAVTEQPDWQEAQENLALSRFVQTYIERTREQSDTGDESELSADGYVFDNKKSKGQQMTITNDSVMEAASAEKWMRSVNTETREFLQMRFALEAAQQ